MADTWQDMVRDVGKGVEYLKKRIKGRSPYVEGMEKAAGIVPTPPPPPPPPEKEKELLKRSTGGSPPFTPAEMKQGYRKL